MSPVDLPATASSHSSTPVSRISSNQDDQDIWHDAIDYVEMEEEWFDIPEAYHADPSSSAGEIADSRIPFTEDCRRGVQQLIRTLGEYGESRMLSTFLARILPGTPTSLAIAANSLYTAITTRQNIDAAAIHALGLASCYLPDNANIVSRLAAFIRDTVTDWTDDTFLQQFLGENENNTSINLFTALAITAIVAGRWMKDEGSPQRGLLKVPAFMANIFIRASHYWAALGNMAGSLQSGAEIPENTGTSPQAPAFEVDTQVEITGDVCYATAPCSSSAPQLTAFSSNSTASPGTYTRATVPDRPAVPEENYPLPVPEQLHFAAVDKLRQESGLSDLLYCTTLKTETHQQTNEKVHTATHFNTKCDAVAYPDSLSKAAESTTVHADIPETQVSSSASQSGGAAFPLLVTTAIAAPMATSYIQALKSKTVLAVGATAGLTVITAGGILWSRRPTQQPEAQARDRAGDKSRDVSSSDNAPLQNASLVKPAVPEPGSSGMLEDAFGNHSLPHHDDTGNRIRHRLRHLPVDLPKKQTTLPAPDDVKIEKLDFSCIEERQNLSVADIFRQIGNTLINPVSELAKESQVIHYYNKFGRCPTKEDIEKLENITIYIDKVVSAVITLLPHSKPLYILQAVGGPLFKLIADDIDQNEDGKIEDMQELAEQMTFLSKSIIESSPVNNKGQVIDEKTSLPKEIFFHKGRICTEINGEKWFLSYKNKRFVATNGNEEREVKYSREDERWRLGRSIKALNAEEEFFGENVVYSIKKTEKIISELAVEAVNYHPLKDANGSELYKVTIANGRIYTCIKINGKFLPVRGVSLENYDSEVYNIKRPEKTGYSIYISSDNKFHFGKFLLSSMKYRADFISYASDFLHKTIPSSYYVNNLDLARFTPINSRGFVKSPDGTNYILLKYGYVKIERHPLFRNVYQLGPSKSDKVLCYYDKEVNKFFLIPYERDLKGEVVDRRGVRNEGDLYNQERIVMHEFEKQKKMISYRTGFRTNDYEIYRIINRIDKLESDRVNKFYLYGLDNEEINHSGKYKKAALEIRKDIINTKSIIEKVKDAVLESEYNSRVMKRLHDIFDIKSGTSEAGELVDLFINHLEGTGKIIEEYISDDFKRIWLIKSNDNDVFAETWKQDPLRRMFINIKQTNSYKKKNTLSGVLKIKHARSNDIPLIIHEASHLGADTEDTFYMGHLKIDDKVNQLKSGSMSKREIKAILDSEDGYAASFSLKTDRERATELFNNKPSLRVKFLLNNADSFAEIITELCNEATKVYKRETVSGVAPNYDIIYLFAALFLE